MRKFVNRLKNIIKTIIVKNKFYKHGNQNYVDNQLVFFIREGYPQPHPGLVDRFKAIVGLYYIAKENHRDFILQYSSPFDLEKYLQPNIYQWNQTKKISYCKKEVRLLQYGQDCKVPVLKKNIPQYHCYFYEGLNILRRAEVPYWEKKWGELYRELFCPSSYLEGLLQKSLPQVPYVAVHIRFVNALEHFEKGFVKNLSEQEKKLLIVNCMDALKKIRKQEQTEIYVFSDSIKFLKEAKKENYCMLPFENVGHISAETDDNVFDKAFIDFYAISRSVKVYSIQGNHLYQSVFSQYASFVGNIEYKVINV